MKTLVDTLVPTREAVVKSPATVFCHFLQTYQTRQLKSNNSANPNLTALLMLINSNIKVVIELDNNLNL